MSGEAQATGRSRVSILVVDDNAGKRLALKAVLDPLGYTIVEAESGRDALRCVIAQDFAVILLDVCMPEMDGFETAALIRLRRQSEMTPIIFITAFASDEIERTDRYTEGAVDFIFAPVPPDDLRAKVSVFANLFIRADDLARRAREVQASADQLRLLTDAAPVGIFQTDADNRYVYTNPQWSEITGMTAREAVGRPWDAVVAPARRAGLIAAMAADGAGNDSVGYRFEIGRSGAASRIVLVTSRPIPDSEGSAVGWVGTLADVTTEAGAEAAMSHARDEANEASRLKSDFLANMSHEIRTPMNGVIGMTDLLLETDLDARQRDYAQTVRNSGEALLAIINDILDFSKVEAGKLEIEETETDLRAVVDDVVNLLAGLAWAKGLTLSSDVDPFVPHVVGGDPGRVRQVLTNLIGNAIKFTQVGEVVVRVTVAAVEDSEAVLRFEVSDTGDGIADDKLGLVFQPFVQADTSTSRKYGGTGLGLAISAQLVALMGGECGVSSRLGVGSEFWFTIRVHADPGPASPGWVPAPVLIGDDDGPGPARPAPRPSTRRPRSGRLLLVEDNLINKKVALAMLSSAGYSVHAVPNGEEAVRAVAADPYDAILMDCQMPVMNGFEATAAIRASEGAGRHTPIIAMTAGARREDRDRCLAEGMDAYLAKPINKDALLALVDRSIRNGGAVRAQPPPADPHPAEVTIDGSVLDELRLLGEGDDQDFLGDLVGQFDRDRAPRLEQLRHAVAIGDTAAVGRLAHSIKGSSGQLGGQRLASSCARLEGKATDGSLSGAGDLAEVERAYQDLCRALAEQIGR